MAGGLEELRIRAEELVTLAAGRPEADRAKRLLDHIAAGRFEVAVVGEFKRGKSTLVNALLRQEIVPSGVLPLTAVATEIAFGDPVVVVELLDGARRTIELARLADYVTESANPENRLEVGHVEVWGRWPLLEPGVVLVDTPGIGSVYRHNTEASRVALLEADGAVMVLSADAPLSDQERELISVLAERRSPTFFVLNKADHLTVDELGTVKRFVEQTLADLFGRGVNIFAVDSRSALAARRLGGRAGGEGIEFDTFADELERFVADDLAGARLSATRAELHRLGVSLQDALSIEEAARNADATDLARLVERFSDEAARQRQGFEDDRTLLDRDVDHLVASVGERLAAFAAAAPAESTELLVKIASDAPRDRLVDDLRSAVEGEVRASLEAFRRTEAARVEEAWGGAALAFRTRTQRRVDEARQAGARLFDVPLPHLDVPMLSSQAEQFSFLFLHVGSTTEEASRALRRLLPSRPARRRALARASAELTAEFDKHAGRTRWDLAQRVDALRIDLEKMMRAELDRSIDAIGEAASRAQQWHESADDEQHARTVDALRLQKIATELVALDGDLK
jgi:GTP-binding protein EngB required for normal cell division